MGGGGGGGVGWVVPLCAVIGTDPLENSVFGNNGGRSGMGGPTLCRDTVI